MAQEVIFGIVPDSVLVALSAKRDTLGIGRLLNEELSAWNAPRNAAYALAHRSIIDKESLDGVIYRDELAPWYEHVALGGADGKASLSDRLACAIALLDCRASAPSTVSEVLAGKAQRLVSETLCDYPALMHPRLAIPTRRLRTSDASHRPVVFALHSARCASLPSIHDGVSAERVRAFAAANVVRNALLRQVANTIIFVPHPSSRRLERTTERYRLLGGQGGLGAPRLPMMTSILEMGVMRGDDPKWPTHPAAATTYLMTVLRARLLDAFGMAPADRPAESTRFIAALKAAGHLSPGTQLRKVMGPTLVSGALRDNVATMLLIKPPPPVDDVRRATGLLVDGLVECDIEADRPSAAGWVYEEALGSARPRDRVLPEVRSVETAVAFIDTLTSLGLTLPDEEPVQAPDARAGLGATHQAYWVNALAICLAKQTMESVLRPEVTRDAPTSAAAPRRRARL